MAGRRCDFLPLRSINFHNPISDPMSTPNQDVDSLAEALEGLLAYCENLEQRLQKAEEQINTLTHAGGGMSSASENVDFGSDRPDLQRVRTAIDDLKS